MKKLLSLVFIAPFVLQAQLNQKLAPYAEESVVDAKGQLSFIKFKTDHLVNEADVPQFINSMIFGNGLCKVQQNKVDRDNFGFSHTRYTVAYKGVTVFNKMIIAHCQDGKMTTLNGDLNEIKAPSNNFSLSEKSALNAALKKVNAKVYKWQVKAEEEHMRQALNQPDFTYYPKGEKVVFEKDGKFYYAYRFNIYAQEPLYRANVFVDASSGKVLAEQNLICNVDVPATVLTKYSSTQTVTCDNNGGTYRFRETARGLGIETYNMNNTNVYSATDFTNATTTWTVVNSDQPARDAHWGAEKTYDYYWYNHNINSIDNAGYKLLSYVHYNTNYNNAFWDGTRMTYGDGNGTQYTVFTALDVCGHEITHGLVSNTGALNGGGTGEPDALNEGFADIFGTSIERYSKPGTWDWIMGKDITVNNLGIRNLSNPNSMSDPDTYGGTYWDPAGEPHNNSTPSTYWFYLLVTGGSGTNDLNNAYTVNGIGNTAAENIAFRALTVYFVPSTNYANCRVACIQAAKDLYGACSNEVIQTTNAWYAVGVGAQYAPGVIGPNFTASPVSICSLPASVNFNNTTQAGLNYTWYFGDGATSTSTNPAHSYTANGTYNVKLVATGCQAGTDSIIKNSYVVINAPAGPTVTGGFVCTSGTVNLSAQGNGVLNWYASPGSSVIINTGTAYTTPNINTTTTYYVVNSVTNAPASGGIPSNVNGSYLTNPAQWLVFDVLQPGTLQSVVVYAQAAGTRTFELRNSNNVVLNTTAINLTAGANTLTLNYNLIPGTGYQLGLNQNSTANLYRSNSGVAYPYGVGTVVNITGSSAGSAYYYWFYNWTVKKADCTSAPVAVTASVGGLNVTASAPSTLVCEETGTMMLSGSPAGGTFSGPGVTGNVFNPSVGPGTYTVNYNYVNGGCNGSANVVLQVAVCTGIKSQSALAEGIQVFPNPANENVTVKNALNSRLRLFESTGKLVLDKSIDKSEEKINVSSFAKGIYFVTLSFESGKQVKSLRLVIE
jgi:Zn-dependent metalloprotease